MLPWQFKTLLPRPNPFGPKNVVTWPGPCRPDWRNLPLDALQPDPRCRRWACPRLQFPEDRTVRRNGPRV
jgi:hypothetical protein